MNEQRILRVNGVELRGQAFGDPAHPAVLLIAGPDRWEEQFCTRLADGLRFVIRYDRATGAGPAEDAIGVLDAFGVGAAHLVAVAGNVTVARELGARHPDRVASLTLIDHAPAEDGGDIPTLIVAGPIEPGTLIPALLRHTSGGWDPQAERLASRYLAAGDPAGWFDPLYRAATNGEVAMPWDRTEPHPLLAEWAKGQDGAGRRAVVVGCGLGADAEFLAGLGYDTVGFDIAPAAVAIARDRHPDTAVDYAVADLLNLPAHWRHGFDLVLDVYTVQALPRAVRPAAIAGIGSLVAPGGTLLTIQVCFDEGMGTDGPPWPLRRDEIDAFAVDGVEPRLVERVMEPGRRIPRWRAEFMRAAEG
ncbi:MAG TPA: methyltransferase domain-containing protein [Mycobacteriales bacterium]|nr:methyltransferase domain-containing protein [Mycobacteriales bacterium]